VKAIGPKSERETIIVVDEEGKLATLWTASESVYQQMLKRDWQPDEDGERHAMFSFPKGCLRLPRQKSTSRGFAGRKAKS
jgi:hypothetical protein